MLCTREEWKCALKHCETIQPLQHLHLLVCIQLSGAASRVTSASSCAAATSLSSSHAPGGADGWPGRFVLVSTLLFQLRVSLRMTCLLMRCISAVEK